MSAGAGQPAVPPSRHGAWPPQQVRRPVMIHRWETLTFLHWPYPVEQVQRLLPPGLEVEPWEGAAWVGLVPFHMRARPPRGPALPVAAAFPETNVRTYVSGPDGRAGVWFFSLDASNLPAVLAARTLYGLPYVLSRMSVRRHADGRVTYLARRRGRGYPAGHDIEVHPEDPFAPEQLGELDHYLTAKFTLWAHHLGVLHRSDADHPAWPLRRARLLRLEEDLVRAAGLPAPAGAPLVHYSDGVDVRIGRPRLVGRSTDEAAARAARHAAPAG